tara:strand:- start:121 stop:270 length:150 start_codon:yes stop_codon:yes gene_type:complete
METTSMKLYALNTFAIGISLSNIEISLRIILLLATIIYTVQKIKTKKNE